MFFVVTRGRTVRLVILDPLECELVGVCTAVLLPILGGMISREICANFFFSRDCLAAFRHVGVVHLRSLLS